MRSVMNHTFSEVPQVRIPRSSFNRSHGYKTTLDEGKLIPIFIDEALPGDTFALDATALMRMSTPLHPIMDNIFVDTFFFAVPIRILWDNWEKFNGAQDNPGDSTDFLIPQATAPAGGYPELHLQDYFGLPTKVDGLVHNNLHSRAYNLIYNEWFRDQNLVNSVTVDTGDGPDNPADYIILPRGKRHDYFTSCLPWPQKGDSVSLPLGTVAPVTGIGPASQGAGPLTYPDSFNIWESEGTQSRAVTGRLTDNRITTDINMLGIEEDPLNPGYPAIYADLSNATAATINSLRQAFQIQRMLERDARGGTRYIELIKSHFGVTSPDYRMQRPEYLGGGSAPINVSPVPQTSESGTSPQGSLAAYATGVLTGNGFVKSFTEHCIVIGLVNVRADLTYQAGLDRMFSRRTRYDFYWPSLAHIGEQAVLSKEIYADGTAADEDVFGYQERYAEYRYKPSRITGLFRSNATLSLDPWHLSEDFSTRPLLNENFITDKPPINRVVAVPSEPHFIGDFYFRFRCARPMPVFGVPGLIDHF